MTRTFAEANCSRSGACGLNQSHGRTAARYEGITRYDDLLPSNAGRWRLTTAGAAPDGGGLEASCAPASDGARADVALDVAELGAAYLGGTPLGALAAAGLVTERRPGAVRQLSTALSWDLAPWCPVNF